MKKKVLVLGAVTMVAGIVAATASGCSSSDSGGGGGGGTEAGVTDAKNERAPLDTGTDDEDAGNCPPAGATLTAAELEDKPGYKPGKLQADSCSTAELTTFEKNLDDTNITTWKDLGQNLGTTCAACIITSTAAADWGPVVYTEDSGGDRGFYNFGACYGVVENNANCGKAVQFLEFCLDAACDECATTSADREACVDKAADTTGMCATFVESLQTECKNIAKTDPKCNDVLKAAKTLCGPASPTDGGTDADANDQ